MCNGGSFEDFFNQVRGGRIPEIEVRAIFRQLLSAFALLDLNGIVHRDLKPDNFVIHFPNLNEEDAASLGTNRMEFL